MDAVAAVVATFDPGAADSRAGGSGDMAGVQEALANTQEAIRVHGCDDRLMEKATEEGLAELSPTDPVAVAVLARITHTLLGRVPPAPEEVDVGPDDDLHDVVARVAAGSTIVLPAGDVELSEPLVFLEGVTVRGAGMEATTLASTAPGASLIDVSGARLVLENLAVEVRGAASGIVAGPNAQLVLTAVRVSGARLDDARTGGAGLHLVGAAPASEDEANGDDPSQSGETSSGSTTESERTSVEVTDSVFTGNAWAGIVISGEHRVSIERATVGESGEVGILFLDSADGSVADSVVSASRLGIGVAGQARPVILDLTVSGGLVGVQLEGSSAATIQGLVLSDLEQAGIIVTGEATGSLTAVTCEALEFGLVIADTAAPTVGDLADCTVARGS